MRAIDRRRIWFCVAAGVLVLPALCRATDVRVVAVTPGRSAAVVIERGAPVMIEVGETVEGVKLLRADRAGAVLSVDGIQKRYPWWQTRRPPGMPLGTRA
jgi:hypothetical protein